MTATADTSRSILGGGAITALAVLGLLGFTACTSSIDARSATPTPVVTSPVEPSSSPAPTTTPLKALPDPAPVDPALNVTVFSAGSGEGARQIALPVSHLRDTSTSIRWVCVGPGSLTIRDSKGVLVSSSCESSSDTGLAVRGGDIPKTVSDLSDLSINAGANTRWRYSVYAVRIPHS